MKCPNKNLKEYKDLVNFTGSEVDALIAYHRNGDEIPSLDKVAGLLAQAPVEKKPLDNEKALQDFIGAHMKATFPDIEVLKDPVKMQEFVDKHFGGDYIVATQAMGAAISNAIWINENNANQITLLHEYGHLFWDMLPNTPEVLSMKKTLLELHGNDIEKVMDSIANHTYKFAKQEYAKANENKIVKALQSFWNSVSKFFKNLSKKERYDDKFAKIMWNNLSGIKKFENKLSVLHYMMKPEESIIAQDQKDYSIRVNGKLMRSVTDLIRKLLGENNKYDDKRALSMFKSKHRTKFEAHLKELVAKGVLTKYDLEVELESAFLTKNEIHKQSGNVIHKLIEYAFNGTLTQANIDELKFKYKDILKEYEDELETVHPIDRLVPHVNNFMEQLKSKYPTGTKFYTETLIGSDVLNSAGIVDLIIELPSGELIVYDYKTTEAFYTDDNGKFIGKYSKGYGYFKRIFKLKNSKENQHRVQLAIYSGILENWKNKVIGAYIVPVKISIPMFMKKDGEEVLMRGENMRLQIPEFDNLGSTPTDKSVFDLNKNVDTRLDIESNDGKGTVKKKILNAVMQVNDIFVDQLSTEKKEAYIEALMSSGEVMRTDAINHVEKIMALQRNMSGGTSSMNLSKTTNEDIESLLGIGSYKFLRWFSDEDTGGYPEDIVFGLKKSGVQVIPPIPLQLMFVLKALNIPFKEFIINPDIVKSVERNDNGDIINVEYQDFKYTDSIEPLIESAYNKEKGKIAGLRSEYQVDLDPLQFKKGLRDIFRTINEEVRSSGYENSIDALNYITKTDSKNIDNIIAKLVNLNSTAVSEILIILQEASCAHYLAEQIRKENFMINEDELSGDPGEINFNYKPISQKVHEWSQATANDLAKSVYFADSSTKNVLKNGFMNLKTYSQIGDETGAMELVSTVLMGAQSSKVNDTFAFHTQLEELKKEAKDEKFFEWENLWMDGNGYIEKVEIGGKKEPLFYLKAPGNKIEDTTGKSEEEIRKIKLRERFVELIYDTNLKFAENISSHGVLIKGISMSKNEFVYKYGKVGVSYTELKTRNDAYRIAQPSKYDSVIVTDENGREATLGTFKAELNYLTKTKTVENSLTGEQLTTKEFSKELKKLKELEKQAMKYDDTHGKYARTETNRRIVNFGTTKPLLSSRNLLYTFAMDLDQMIHVHHMRPAQSALGVFTAGDRIQVNSKNEKWLKDISGFLLYKKYTFELPTTMQKYIHWIMQAVILKTMALSPEVWMNNVVVGQMLDIIREGHAWKKGWSRMMFGGEDSWKKAMNIAKNFDIANITTDFRDLYNTSIANKIDPYLYFGMEYGEKINQLPIIIGKMTDEQWEAYNSNGEIIKGKEKSGLTDGTIRELKSKVARLHGFYGQHNIYPFKLNQGLNWLFQLIGWLPATVARRLSWREYTKNGETRLSMAKAVYHMARIATFYAAKGASETELKEIRRMNDENNSLGVMKYELDIVQKALVNKDKVNIFDEELPKDYQKGLIEAGMTLSFLGTMISWLKFAPDDDEPDKWYEAYLRRYLLDYLGERAFLNYIQMSTGKLSLDSSKIPALSWLFNMAKVLTDLWDIAHYGIDSFKAPENRDISMEDLVTDGKKNVFGLDYKIIKDVLQVVPFGTGIGDANEFYRFFFSGEKQYQDNQKEFNDIQGFSKDDWALFNSIYSNTNLSEEEKKRRIYEVLDFKNAKSVNSFYKTAQKDEKLDQWLKDVKDTNPKLFNDLIEYNRLKTEIEKGVGDRKVEAKRVVLKNNLQKEK